MQLMFVVHGLINILILTRPVIANNEIPDAMVVKDENDASQMYTGAQFRRQKFTVESLTTVTTTTEKLDKTRDTFYQPYWHQGNWVFDRFTTIKTLKPTTTTTRFTRTATTTTPTTIDDKMCGVPCPDLFKRYGPICAIRYDQTRDYQTYYNIDTGAYPEFLVYQKDFGNLCLMMHENTCHYKVNYNWLALYRGKCRYKQLYDIYGYGYDARYTHLYYHKHYKTVLQNQKIYNDKGSKLQNLDWNWYSLGVKVYKERQMGGGNKKAKT